MGCVTEDSKRPRDSSADGFRPAENQADDCRQYEFVAGASGLDSFVFEMLRMLEGTSVPKNICLFTYNSRSVLSRLTVREELIR